MTEPYHPPPPPDPHATAPPDAPTETFGAPGSTRADLPPARRLQRRTSGKVLGGVAGGLGDFTGVDPVLYRVLFAVLTLFGGTGVLLYLIGWLFLPADDQPVSPVESLVGRSATPSRARDIGIAAALVLAGLCLAGVLARGNGDDVALVVLVVVAAYFLLRRLGDRRGEGPPPVTPAPRPYEAAFPTGGTATLTAPVAAPPAAPSAPPETRRDRFLLAPATVSVLLLVLGVTAALDAGGTVDPAPEDYLALAVAVLGIGLVVGAFFGRARGLVFLGLPLVVALAVLGSTGVSLRGGVGDRQYAPERAVEIQDEYRVGVGSLRLDLSDVDLSGRLTTVRLSAGVGAVEVVVPANADVGVEGRARLGDAELFDRTQNGSSIRLGVVDDAPEGDGKLDLVLDMQVDVGKVEVSRAQA